MYKIIKKFNHKIEIIDKYMLIFISLIPILLAISIFMADLFASIAGLILIYIFLKKNIIFFRSIKKEIYLMIIFYSIILISLLLTDYFKISFLPSFFYFRYFLVSLSIFYLLKKYDFLMSFFLYVVSITILFVTFDSIFQFFNGKNLFGYKAPGLQNNNPDTLIYLTGFFDQEKKLGSYLIRFLPLILGLIYFSDKIKYINLNKYILVLIGIIIFFASERTSLFLYLIFLASYILISKQKLIIIIYGLLILSIIVIFNPLLKNKYVNVTLEQMGIVKSTHYKTHKISFISEEHENLIYGSIIVFKNNPLLGSGVKTFFAECNKVKKIHHYKDLPAHRNNNRNRVECSTHPHSTYFQLLADVGIFGFMVIFYFLCYLILTFYKILFRLKKFDKYFLSYYYINIGVLINLFPLIPSGSFFNNWISLMISYIFGFWLFLKTKINQKKYT